MPKYQTRLQVSSRLAGKLEQDQDMRRAAFCFAQKIFQQRPQQEQPPEDAYRKLDFVSPLLNGASEGGDTVVRQAGELLADYCDPVRPERRPAVLEALCRSAEAFRVGSPDFSCLTSGLSCASANGEADVLAFLRYIRTRKTLDYLLWENPGFAQSYFEKGSFPELAYEATFAALADAPLVSAGTELFYTPLQEEASCVPEIEASDDAADVSSLEFLAGVCAAYGAAADGRTPQPIRLTLSDPAEQEGSGPDILQERSAAFERIFCAALAAGEVMDTDPLSLIFIDGVSVSQAGESPEAARAEAIRTLLGGCHSLDVVLPVCDAAHRLVPSAVSVELNLRQDGDRPHPGLGKLHWIVPPLLRRETPADLLDRFNENDRLADRVQRHARLERETAPLFAAGELLCRKRGALIRILRQWAREFGSVSPPPSLRDDCQEMVRERRGELFRACSAACPSRRSGEKDVEKGWDILLETELTPAPLPEDPGTAEEADRTERAYRAAAERYMILSEGRAAMESIAERRALVEKDLDGETVEVLHRMVEYEMDAMDRIPFNAAAGLELPERSEYRACYARLLSFVSAPASVMEPQEYGQNIRTLWRLAQQGVANLPDKPEFRALSAMNGAQALEYLEALRENAETLDRARKQVRSSAAQAITRLAAAGMTHIGLERLAAARKYADPEGAAAYLRSRAAAARHGASGQPQADAQPSPAPKAFVQLSVSESPGRTPEQ